MKKCQLGHFHYRRGRTAELRGVHMEQGEGRSTRTGVEWICTDIAFMYKQNVTLKS